MTRSVVATLVVVVLMIAPYGVEGYCGDSCEGALALVADNPGLFMFVGLAIGVGGATALQRAARDRYQQGRLRPCPRCGEAVAVGVLDCPHCEFNFRTIGSEARHG